MQVRNLFLSILSVSVLVTSCNSKADEAPVSPFDALIPMPVSLKKDTGAFVLNEKTKILTDTIPAVQKLATQFAEQLKPSLGFQMEVATAGTNDSNAIKLELNASETSVGKEGYNLSVSGTGVKITAADVAGLFYGLQTVRQLLPHSIESSTATKGPWTIPATTISDTPEYLKWET
jgi:hexosaminidase